MDNDIEGIGAAITGGLAARAVEPAHGEGREGDHAAECANCSMPLDGPHCRYCGQKAHVHRSIGAILHELIHGVLHLDGKFWRTLPLLAWRPGELTRRYAHGERAKFVSPLGMFLFSVFLMFALFSAFGLSLANIDVDSPDTIIDPDAAAIDLQEQLDGVREERVALRRRIASVSDDPSRQDEYFQLVEELNRLDTRIEGMERGQEALGMIGGSADEGPAATAAEPEAPAQTDADGDLAPESAAQGEDFFVDFGDEFTTGWHRLDEGIRKLNENPTLALYKLQANGFKFSWLLIPISVPFVWLLFFWTRRFRMYDHAVFVTYSLAFMSLLVIALTLFGFAGLGGNWIAVAAIAIPPIHMFRQLKNAYGLHWSTALLRTFILLNFCGITAILFFVLLLGIGALG